MKDDVLKKPKPGDPISAAQQGRVIDTLRRILAGGQYMKFGTGFVQRPSHAPIETITQTLVQVCLAEKLNGTATGHLTDPATQWEYEVLDLTTRNSKTTGGYDGVSFADKGVTKGINLCEWNSALAAKVPMDSGPALASLDYDFDGDYEYFPIPALVGTIHPAWRFNVEDDPDNPEYLMYAPTGIAGSCERGDADACTEASGSTPTARGYIITRDGTAAPDVCAAFDQPYGAATYLGGTPHWRFTGTVDSTCTIELYLNCNAYSFFAWAKKGGVTYFSNTDCAYCDVFDNEVVGRFGMTGAGPVICDNIYLHFYLWDTTP
jgi:hypothetical protein